LKRCRDEELDTAIGIPLTHELIARSLGAACSFMTE
jgi:hypothetical protein